MPDGILKITEMKTIDFYKFIHDNEIEFHWHYNDETREDDVIFFVECFNVQEFNKMLPKTAFDDDAISCKMKDGYFAFWASDILDPEGIDLVEIFGKDDNKYSEI